jgi:hypothetical protein
MKFWKILHRGQLCLLLKTEKSRRVTESRPVCGTELFKKARPFQTQNNERLTMSAQCIVGMHRPFSHMNISACKAKK